ncbi:hypothetical protein [Alicyclobacillus sp. SO9]|uniref:hypothetical protein n=1 Tax=Alicyclobacillus sp. SO9 TaxID=2665646 RepID=UPI001E4DDD2E|nr:hypothetical protein [Alicyclobacillus sp. SO9]
MMQMRRHKTAIVLRYIALVLLPGMIAFGVCSFPAKAQAAPTSLYSISTSVGINGYYDQHHLVPVLVKIKNQGAAVNASLHVTLSPSALTKSTLDGTLQYPIHLAAKSVTKKVIAFPGSVIGSGSPLELTIGNETVASSVLSGNLLGNVALIAVVSNSPQGAQFLSGSTDPVRQEPVLAERISPSELPSEADWMDDLTAISISPKVLLQLSKAQTRALDTWVKLGGVLLVTGPGRLSGTWSKILPLAASGPRAVPSLSLREFAGAATPISGGKVNSYAKPISSLHGIHIWAGTAHIPLLAEGSLGRGVVVQTGFSPLAPKLLGWTGNASLWSTILQKSLLDSNNAFPNLTGKSGASSLSNASDTLSPMRIPSLTFWGPLFAVYLFIAGPGLFFILRRYRKEPMAWWILPAISLVTTAAIYGFGSIQRPRGVLSETVGMLELTGDGQAEAYSVTGFTSPYTTFATLSANGLDFAVPMVSPQGRQHGQATVTFGTHVLSQFEGVGRWNLRYLYAQGTVSGTGQIRTTLDASSGPITGIVQNDTPYNLQDVAVLWNGKLFEVGNLGSHAQTVIGPKTKYKGVRGNWLTEYGQYNGDITHGLGRALGSYIATMDSGLSFPQGRAMIVASTDSMAKAFPRIHTAQKVITNEHLVFIREFAKVRVQ